MYYDLVNDGVTQSMIATILACPAKAKWRYRELLASPPSRGVGALDFGDLFHRALDQLHQRAQAQSIELVDQMADDCINKVKADDLALIRSSVSDLDAEQDLEIRTGMARAVMHEYVKQYPTDFDPNFWVAIEEQFQASYQYDQTPIKVLGKYDGVVRAADGKLWLLETKTRANPYDEVTLDKLEYDLQVNLYWWSMLQKYGEMPGGVLYNIIKRPQLRLKKSETVAEYVGRIRDDIKASPDSYYVRFSHPLDQDAFTKWCTNDLSLMMEVVYNWATTAEPYRNPGSCMTYNRPCSYVKTCAHGLTQHLIKKDRAHSELEAEVPSES